MLKRIDRLQLAVPDRGSAAKCWTQLLGAEPAPDDPANTMGRFFARFGESFYMAFAESHALAAIETCARELGSSYTLVPPTEGRGGGADTVFLHPAALGGVMLGLSRPSQAWQWSGHPERVVTRS